MTAVNLHRIMGAHFEHIKPNLCPTCAFYKHHAVWDGYCSAKGKLLSAPTEAKKPRCKDYEPMTRPIIDPELAAILLACWFSAQGHGWESRPVEAGEWQVSKVLLWWQ